MRVFALAVVSASLALSAYAQQDYPNRTVTVVNPTQAGATTTSRARSWSGSRAGSASSSWW